MALSAHLHLRQSQSLVMTPQLMQSIQLLQMTGIELTQFLATEIEKNPLLELAGSEATATDSHVAASGAPEGPDHGPLGRSESASFGSDRLSHDASQDLPSPLMRTERFTEAMDANFRDNFPGEEATAPAAGPELSGQWKSMAGHPGASDGFDPDDLAAGQDTLSAIIEQQIALAFADPVDRFVARELAGALDESGYLDAQATPELAERLGQDQPSIERVLTVLQGFDPPGIFARSLSECLAIQLRQAGRLTETMERLLAHLDLLARRDFAALSKLCGTTPDHLMELFGELRRLNPKPGAGFGSPVAETLIPDVTVKAAGDGSWLVELVSEALPRVLVNRQYYAEVSRLPLHKDDDRLFLSECLQNANWLVRSLDQRAQSILKVAREIVRQQDLFLVKGVSYLRPLTLKQVAEAIGMHESTVSRVTTGKYMATPRGVFEMKYFFTAAIASSEGGLSHSAEAVRHRIAALIRAEDSDAVLSDDDLVVALREDGIDIARRTVAKYREALGFASSVQRRREKRAAALALA